jgi:ribA/ribD-fused uncharacterized protein
MTEKFTLFWKSKLSQWHMVDFVVDGVKYNCAEQYMMSEKAKLFGDLEMYRKIMATKSPKEQQDYGRQVKNFDIDIWNENARKIVFRGNMARFTQNEEQKKHIMSTDGTTLVEASPYDRVWGIGLSKDDPASHCRDTWRGKNWLGEVLTLVREEIKRLDAIN